MPIYEYRCDRCGRTFEKLVRGRGTVTCPDCGSVSLEKLLSTPALLSGRTARPTGQTCCGREERCDAPPCSTDDACWRG